MVSSLSLTYKALYKKQEKLSRYLTYEEARREIQSTPGIIFSPGTSFYDILNKLQGIGFVALDPLKQRIFVISSGLEEKTKKFRKYKSERAKNFVASIGIGRREDYDTDA